MAEIQLDQDTSIRDLEDSSSRQVDVQPSTSNAREKNAANSNKQTPKSIVVKIPVEKFRDKSNVNALSSSSKRSSREDSQKSTDYSKPPSPYPAPANYNIPLVNRGERTEKTEEDVHHASPAPTDRSPARSNRRSRSPGRRRRTPPARSHSRERGRSSRSPRRRSPRRSRSRERYRSRGRFSRSPRRRSPSPYFRPRSPPRFFRPRDSPPRRFRPRDERPFSRSPSRDFGPPRWGQGGIGSVPVMLINLGGNLTHQTSSKVFNHIFHPGVKNLEVLKNTLNNGVHLLVTTPCHRGWDPRRGEQM